VRPKRVEMCAVELGETIPGSSLTIDAASIRICEILE
jgi:hypothetical protein